MIRVRAASTDSDFYEAIANNSTNFYHITRAATNVTSLTINNMSAGSHPVGAWFTLNLGFDTGSSVLVPGTFASMGSWFPADRSQTGAATLSTDTAGVERGAWSTQATFIGPSS